MPSGPALSTFQLDVAQVFFALPEARGFLLAGGAALLAQELTFRPTHDLDFFTAPGAGDVGQARDAFVLAAGDRGWSVEHITAGDTFSRLLVHGPEELLVDLALEGPPELPASVSVAGPTFAPRELAGRKLLALFDRAAARDFVDVFSLAAIFSEHDLLTQAKEIDRGFDPQVLAAMMNRLSVYSDADLLLDPRVTDIARLRAFFAAWATRLG